MDRLEELLQEELDLALDRMAGETTEGTLALLTAARPDLRGRADALEAEIAGGRIALLRDHARWQEAVDELADLWALASAQCRATQLDTATTGPDRRAA